MSPVVSPFEDEPGGETVHRDGEEPLRLRRVDVYGDHLHEQDAKYVYGRTGYPLTILLS